MAYQKVYQQLADASDCGADQQWDPNATFPGLPPGQCIPKTAQLAPAPDSGFWGGLTKFGAAVAGALGPKPQAPVVQQAGMSTTTKVLLAAGAVGVVALLLARR